MKGYDDANHIEVLRSFLEIPPGSADGVFDRFLPDLPATYRRKYGNSHTKRSL